MAKLPYFQFYPLDWLRDTRKLSPLGKAVWIDILALAWNEPERGIYSREREAMARELGLSRKQLDEAFLEILEVGDVSSDNGRVTVKSRRMVKEEMMREKDRIRQQRYRGNGSVTDEQRESPQEKLEVRSQKLEVRELQSQHIPALEFEKIWMRYPKRIGKKAALRHFNAGVSSESDFKAISRALENYISHIKKTGIEFKYIKQGDTWFNNWHDWIDYKEPNGGPNGTHGGESIFVQAARRQRAKEAEGLRGVASAGEIFDRIRSLPNVPAENGGNSGVGDNGHAEAVGALRPENPVEAAPDREHEA